MKVVTVQRVDVSEDESVLCDSLLSNLNREQLTIAPC